MKDKHCCDAFKDFIPLFYWMTLDEKYIMPHVIFNIRYKLRINYCPSCGAEVRDIELTEI